MRKFYRKVYKLLSILILAVMICTYPQMIFGEGEKLSEDIEITLHLKATDNLSGVSKVMISNYSDFRDSQWEDISEDRDWVLAKDAEVKTIYVKYMDGAGNISKAYSKTIPENLLEETLVVNNHNPYINDDKIVININTTEPADEFSLSNDRKNWGGWQELKKEIEYEILGEEGKKKIFIRFKNNDGKIVKKLIPGVIILDRTPPTIENIKFYKDENKDEVSISADFKDEMSGIAFKKWDSGEKDLDYFKEHGTEFEDSSIIITESGDYTFYAEDRAGNTSIKKFNVDKTVFVSEEKGDETNTTYTVEKDLNEDEETNINNNINNEGNTDEDEIDAENDDNIISENNEGNENNNINNAVEENNTDNEGNTSNNDNMVDEDQDNVVEVEVEGNNEKGIEKDIEQKTDDKGVVPQDDKDKNSSDIENSIEENKTSKAAVEDNKDDKKDKSLRVLWIILIAILVIGYMLWKKLKSSKNAAAEIIHIGGKKIKVIVIGKGDNTVVIVPDAENTMTEWKNTIDEISKNSRVVVLENGISEISNSKDSIEETVKDIYFVLEKLHITEPVIFVGQSYGGVCVEYFAKMYPERTESIVLVDSSYEINELEAAVTVEENMDDRYLDDKNIVEIPNVSIIHIKNLDEVVEAIKSLI